MGTEQLRKKNTRFLKLHFKRLLRDIGAHGVVGVANFRCVYEELMHVQQERLKLLAKERFEDFMKQGSFISIGIAYAEKTINDINVINGKTIDMERWNNYASEYSRINGVLDRIAQHLAAEFEGMAIPATLSGLANKVEHVTDYFGNTVSHRTVAEMAGLGWRGKNGLIINETYSCALRFASIVTEIPLSPGRRLQSKCGRCTACEDACSFIKNRARLKDYRENCRRYMVGLQRKGLDDEVCGKCIQACYRNGLFSRQFRLENE
ncbi:MAG: hypothetical protein C4K48_11885 [Candidatus Thorarchaeota archaeon]|nr:MAG: hypothetical protein C4K48_11885 [Candidatus Thorarchaeota archaeon]